MTDAIYTGRAGDATARGTWARRWGWWGVTEWRLRTMRAYATTVLTMAFGNPLLYLVGMGMGLGALVQADVAGLPYLRFVAPGLLVGTVFTMAYQESAWPVMDGFTWRKFYLGTIATPVTPGQIALGEAVAVSLRVLVQSVLFWLVGLLLGVFPAPTSWLVPLVATGAAMALHTPTMAFTATQRRDTMINLLFRVVVMPMFLFAGTFYPIDRLPVWLQWIGWISPLWHGGQLARVVGAGMAEPAWLTIVHVVVLGVVTLAGLLAARVTFARRVIA